MILGTQPQYSVKITEEQWQKLGADNYFDIRHLDKNNSNGTITLSLNGDKFTYQCYKKFFTPNSPKYTCQYNFSFSNDRTDKNMNFASYIVSLHAMEISNLASNYSDIEWYYENNFGEGYITYSGSDSESLQNFIGELFRISDIRQLYRLVSQVHSSNKLADSTPDFLSYPITVIISDEVLGQSNNEFVFGNHLFTTHNGSYDLFLLYEENCHSLWQCFSS